MGWGKRKSCWFEAQGMGKGWDIFLLLQVNPHGFLFFFAVGRGKQIKATSLSTKQAWGLNTKRLGRAGGKKKDLF